METLTNTAGLWLIPTLYLVCFSGLTYAFMLALRAGADSYERVYSEQTARQFADIFFFIPPRRIRDLAWTAAIAFFLIFFFFAGDFKTVAGFLRGLFIGVLAGMVALTLPRWYLGILKQRRLQLFNEQLVDALMTMSSALRAGSSITQTFEHIVRQNLPPISQEFDFFLQQTRIGVKFEDALVNLEKRVKSEDLTLMIRSIEIARQTGGNLTEVFDKIAAVIRERIRIQGRIRTLTSQGRMQGIVVGLMPIALIFALFLLDPVMMTTFFTSSAGIMTGCLALFLELIGALLIRKIMRIDI
ncbi:MAG: type II secretion system F family protein [Kiritimatiellae bacterium]|nr:type II secretion system F family protein [Kiritimatiellia bacterium]